MNRNLFIEQLELGGMANFSYIIGDKASGDAAVIDPHDDTNTLESAAEQNNLTIKTVLLTHGHFDHVGGVRHFADKRGCPVYLSKDEFMLFVPGCKTLKRLNNNDEIPIGDFLIKCLSTPGHSPGGISFLVEGNLFTGDTLFIDAIGRADLPGGNSSVLFKSLQKIKQLPEDTIIWPGHNYGRTTYGQLKTLKTENPFLACETEEEFQGLTG